MQLTSCRLDLSDRKTKSKDLVGLERKLLNHSYNELRRLRGRFDPLTRATALDLRLRRRGALPLPQVETRAEHVPGQDADANAAKPVVGYIRVSSASQDHAYQRAAIESAARARGDTIADWYADKASGATMHRPQLGRLWSDLDRRRIGRVWIWRLDRLTRSGVADAFEAVDFVRRSGAELVSVADQFALDGGGAGELVLAVLAWAAKMEREKIRENQEAARARLARQGRGWGRPRIPPELRDVVRELSSQGFSVREIAHQLKVSKTWVANALNEIDP